MRSGNAENQVVGKTGADQLGAKHLTVEVDGIGSRSAQEAGFRLSEQPVHAHLRHCTKFLLGQRIGLQGQGSGIAQIDKIENTG